MDRAITLINSMFARQVIGITSAGKNIGELKSEIIRKILHFLIAMVPGMAAINKTATITILMIGTLGYALMEYLRLSGVKVPVISSLTSMASRPRDFGCFVMGPVTLGLGALLALLLYPSNAAAIAIYALAFGDGFASLAGKFLGRWRPVFLNGKSIEGSLACFIMVLLSAYAVCGSAHIAFAAAFTAMVVEALPLEDYDNLVIPVTVGMTVQLASGIIL
ncbi:MAG: phosphatidate cytidylyltransferase [Treponema sp.]|jgi:dolichol kinase|nr:phosphatidate cytidylyltransferase [Treponema sp.]